MMLGLEKLYTYTDWIENAIKYSLFSIITLTHCLCVKETVV